MNPKKRKILIHYILLAYGFSWSCWILAFFLGYDDSSFMDMTNMDFTNSNLLLPFLFFRLGIYGPLISSLFLTHHYYKKQGLKNFLKKIVYWKLHLKWYSIAFLLPLFIVFLVWVIGILLSVPPESFFNSQIPLHLFLAFFLYQIFTSGLEEPGWRGFALELLLNSNSYEKTNWILGTIWAIWHFPYVIFLYYTDGLIFTLFSLIGFSLSIIGQTFIFSWLYVKTKSIFLMILFHAWLNTATTFVLGDITIDNPIMGTVPALVTWGIVFLLLKFDPIQTIEKNDL